MKIKTFDCVQMKRRGAERVREKTKDKSPMEQLKFRKQGTEQLKKIQKETKKHK